MEHRKTIQALLAAFAGTPVLAGCLITGTGLAVAAAPNTVVAAIPVG